MMHGQTQIKFDYENLGGYVTTHKKHKSNKIISMNVNFHLRYTDYF